MLTPYLSICIPTNGRIEILQNTLDSIFANEDVDYSDFEVVLSDNSTNNDLPILLEAYKSYPNITYYKTDCEGFLNSANALKMANGLFLKLHNNYTMFDKGCLKKLISFVKIEQKVKPVTFFTNGALSGIKLKKFNEFDSFVFNLSYWNTWSTGFSIWKQDYQEFSNHDLNKMFPHTSLLFLQHNKSSFAINNEVFFINQEVPQKGGYNLFKTFSVDYLQMVENCKINGWITSNTFLKIKTDLFYKFLVEWYSKTKIQDNNFTYDLSFIKKSISVYYSNQDYYLLVFLAYNRSFQNMAVRALKAAKKILTLKKHHA